MLKNRNWQIIPFWIIFPVAGIVSWQLTMIFLHWDIPIRWWNFGLAIGLLHVIFSYSLLEGLFIIPINANLRYRLSFLISVGFGVLLWWGHPYSWAVIPAVVFGSFLGCLIAPRRN